MHSVKAPTVWSSTTVLGNAVAVALEGLGNEFLEVLPGQLVDGISGLARHDVLEELSAVPAPGEGDGGCNHAQQRCQELTCCVERREEGMGDDLACWCDGRRLLL